MTKSDLIAQLWSGFRNWLLKTQILVVKMILDALSEALVKGDRIEIRKFGGALLNYRPPRVGP